MKVEKIYDHGWVKLASDAPLSAEFWIDGFDPIEDEQERFLHGSGRRGVRSPILDYQDGGIGAVQWLNLTHDTAAIVKSDGGWKDGGVFHLWISPGAGERPYKIPLHPEIAVKKGDDAGWYCKKEQAVHTTERLLGLTIGGEPLSS